MSRIDEELRKALAESEVRAAEDSPKDLTSAVDVRNGGAESSVARAGGRADNKSNWGLLAALLVMGGGILTLVMTNFDNAAIYSMGVDQLQADAAKVKDRNLRVEGILVSGSLVKRNEPCEYRFRIQKNGAELEVHYPQCVVPDTFRDVKGVDVQITAEGRLAAGGHLQATQIFAKCPSKYDMKQVAETAGFRPEHEGQAGDVQGIEAEGPMAESPFIPAVTIEK